MGSSESRKHEHKNKMGGNFLSNFSHAFYFNSCLPHYLGGGGGGGGVVGGAVLLGLGCGGGCSQIAVSLSLIK